MKLLQKNRFSPPTQCPYISSENGFIQEYFFAIDVTKSEYQSLLEKSWRRFGIFYFRYACSNCSKCKALRIDLKNFKLSKSQKKVVKKNKNTRVIIKKLQPSIEIYKVYENHSLNKFNKKTNIKDFLETYYYENNFALQSEYYIENKLVAIGFIDEVNNALSSIYFAYNTDYSNYSLGTFSVIHEAEYAKSLNMDFYYLGYYINENKSMKYKNNFKENQILDKNINKWIKNNE